MNRIKFVKLKSKAVAQHAMANAEWLPVLAYNAGTFLIGTHTHLDALDRESAPIGWFSSVDFAWVKYDDAIDVRR